jgi:YwiC-like protein
VSRPDVEPSPGASRVSLRAVALPAEHGGWGFLVEPLIVGLAVAPAPAGAAIAAAAVGAFLGRHPLKLALGDLRRGRVYPRTRAAWGFALLYAALAALAIGLATRSAPARFWAPLLAAAPAALLQLRYDVRNRGRDLAPELLGAMAPGSAAAAIAVAGGWPMGRALLLWLLLAARAAACILYVRTRLRLDRGQQPGLLPAAASHAGALLLVAGLAGAGVVPWLCALAFAILLARAAHGMSAWRRRLRPQALGFQELGYGLLTAALLALAYSGG